MKRKKLLTYWLCALAGVLAVSYYPLQMGVRVICDMLTDGTVMKENYPKYVIPYTPAAFAVILGVLLLPLLFRLMKGAAFYGAAAFSAAVFFAAELLFEQKIVVTTAEQTVRLKDWQMFTCYMPPDGWGQTVTEYKTHTAAEILMGEYHPAFKLHFYLISVLLIFAVLNSIYGFAQMYMTGDRSRKRVLMMQSVSAAAFLGLCILACFTAFWRDGSIAVSPRSAVLMSAFFIIMGVTAGMLSGSLLLKRHRAAGIRISAAVSAAVTCLMYLGEMILLDWHLYRFGSGPLFDGLPAVILAPADILVILISGAVTYLLMRLSAGASAGQSASQRKA